MNEESGYTAAIVSELQERLLADKDGSCRRAADAELEAWEWELRRALQAGLPPAEYETARRLQQGVEAARQILADCCRPAGG